MNKDFILLEDGNAIVSDENGNMEKRYCGNSFQAELLSENKKEIIDTKLNEASEKLDSDKKVKLLGKWMLIAQPILMFVLFPLFGFLIDGLSNISNFFAAGLVGAYDSFLTGGAVAILASVYWGITYSIYNRKVNNGETLVNSIKKVQEDYEKNNNTLKEEEYRRHSIIQNTLYSLNDETQVIRDAIDGQIDMYVNEESSGMKLTRKYK